MGLGLLRASVHLACRVRLCPVGSGCIFSDRDDLASGQHPMAAIGIGKLWDGEGVTHSFLLQHGDCKLLETVVHSGAGCIPELV